MLLFSWTNHVNLPECLPSSLLFYSFSTQRGPQCSYIFFCVDQIADGMTLQVKVVNLLLETGGGAHREGGAAW